MTKVRSTIRIAIAAALSFALIITAAYAPAAAPEPQPRQAQSIAQAPAIPTIAITAHAATPTPPAVTAPTDIATAQIDPLKDYVYNAKKRTPSPKVTIGGKKLKKDRDFTVKYKDNKLPGTAKLTIKGKAPNYTGEQTVTFKIIVQTPTKFKLKTTSDSISASWKKPSGKITGYKITYAANAKFTKTKKSKAIKSSKATGFDIDRPYHKRSYYVKLRAYVRIGGKDYHSPYTAVKSRKVGLTAWYKKLAPSIGASTKWIEADLSKQVVYLHKGNKIVKHYAMSSGRPGTATVRGTFRLYKKIKLHDMRGDWNPETQEWGYVTPNVKWASYFKAGYAFHGSYWNPEVNKPVDVKRTPRSHGCVNMREKDAKYLYSWAPIGTLVTVHK
jgi:lipoprotein-anchoring transpeptidase ErfK/SrfK